MSLTYIFRIFILLRIISSLFYLIRFTESQWDILSNVYKKDRTAQTFLSNYIYNDLAAIVLNGNSTNTWSISPPDIDRLRLDVASSMYFNNIFFFMYIYISKPHLSFLDNSLNIKFSYVISHKSNSKDNPTTIEEEIDVVLEAMINGKRNPQRDILNNMLDSKNNTEW